MAETMTEEKLADVPHDEWIPAERNDLDIPLRQWKLKNHGLTLALGKCVTKDRRSSGVRVDSYTEDSTFTTTYAEVYKVGDYRVTIQSNSYGLDPHGGQYRMKIEEAE